MESHAVSIIREAVPVDKQVAITVYKLASCCEYRVVGNAFGVHKSTVKKYFYKVVNAINFVLFSKYIVFPDKTEALRIAADVEKKLGWFRYLS